MTKKEQKVVDNYYNQYNIDLRTMGMIVHHYIDCGEREISSLTQDFIDEYYKKLTEEEAANSSETTISLITPDFTCYLLTACMGLYQLDRTVRYKLIKEWL